MTTSDMLTHPWILVTNSVAGSTNGGHLGMKKKKSASTLVVDFGGSQTLTTIVKLSLKELLNVSTDWKEVNNNIKSGQGGGAS